MNWWGAEEQFDKQDGFLGPFSSCDASVSMIFPLPLVLALPLCDWCFDWDLNLRPALLAAGQFGALDQALCVPVA